MRAQQGGFNCAQSKAGFGHCMLQPANWYSALSAGLPALAQLRGLAQASWLPASPLY